MTDTKNRIANYLVSFVTLVVGWVILEVTCGFVYRHLPEKFSNGKRIVEVNLGRTESIPASIIQHPYMLYANHPGYVDSVQQHNSMGYRSPEFTLEKDGNTLRILALGGSTTYGYLNKDPQTVWPAMLQKMLQPHFSKKVEVINAGLKYGTSAELLSGYMFRHRYLKPDLVIFHEGGNDAIPVFFPGYNPEYTHFRKPGSGTSVRKGEQFLLRSNVFKVFYSLWLNTYETVYKSQPHALDKLVPADVDERIANDKNYEGFRRNVDLLVRMAKMDSANIVLFGFVQAREENLSKKRPDHKGLEKAVITAVAKNKSIMRALANQHEIRYIDAPQDAFKDEWFLDNCHLNAEGDAMKAKIVYEQILPLLKPEK